jgi:antitoxin component YwqK of YwqJK toxin-antitoxin module
LKFEREKRIPETRFKMTTLNILVEQLAQIKGNRSLAFVSFLETALGMIKNKNELAIRQLKYKNFKLVREMDVKNQQIQDEDLKKKAISLVQEIGKQVGMTTTYMTLSDEEVKDLEEKEMLNSMDHIVLTDQESDVEELMNNIKSVEKSCLPDVIRKIHQKVIELKNPQLIKLKNEEDWQPGGYVYVWLQPDLWDMICMIRIKLGIVTQEVPEHEVIARITSARMYNEIQKLEIEKDPDNNNSLKEVLLKFEKKEIRTANDNKLYISYSFYLENEDEVKDGEYIEFWPGTDVIRLQGTLKKGKLEGVWIQKNKKGIVLTIQSFKEDIIHGDEFHYDEDGNLTTFYQQKNGVLQGLHRTYGENNKMDVFVDGKEGYTNGFKRYV